MPMEETNNIKSKLEDFKNSNPFKTPDNYFNSILPKVQQKISEKNVEKVNLNWIFAPKKLIAASILIGCLVFIIFLSIKVILPFWKEKDTFKQEEIARYLDSQAYSLDDAILTAEIEIKSSDLPALNIEKNDTIEFLLNYPLNSEDIFNEL
jgi:hypothetical protein